MTGALVRVTNKPRAGKSTKGVVTPTPKGRKPRSGLPKTDSIVSTTQLTSPITGRRYRILHTVEMDPYDKPTASKKKIR